MIFSIVLIEFFCWNHVSFQLYMPNCRPICISKLFVVVSGGTTPTRMDWSKAKDIIIGYLLYTVFPYLYIYSKIKYLLSHVYL